LGKTRRYVSFNLKNRNKNKTIKLLLVVVVLFIKGVNNEIRSWYPLMKNIKIGINHKE
jgi:hypothetical protein